MTEQYMTWTQRDFNIDVMHQYPLVWTAAQTFTFLPSYSLSCWPAKIAENPWPHFHFPYVSWHNGKSTRFESLLGTWDTREFHTLMTKVHSLGCLKLFSKRWYCLYFVRITIKMLVINKIGQKGATVRRPESKGFSGFSLWTGPSWEGRGKERGGSVCTSKILPFRPFLTFL